MNTPPSGAPTVDAIRAALSQVMDPEVGMNIVDLGLVYDIRIREGRVEVDLTMTTPSCPMGPMIVEEARGALGAEVPEATAIAVNLVWDPPWDPTMMSDRAREHFGWR
jgi:metal-sulfur cluster biosynthetic enzyme